MLKIGFFGAGKMAQALAKGFLTAGEFRETRRFSIVIFIFRTLPLRIYKCVCCDIFLHRSRKR